MLFVGLLPSPPVLLVVLLVPDPAMPPSKLLPLLEQPSEAAQASAALKETMNAVWGLQRGREVSMFESLGVESRSLPSETVRFFS
jgi:hypothetical protein